MLPFSLVVSRGHGWFKLTACAPTIYYFYCLEFVLPVGPERKFLFVESLFFTPAFGLA